MKTKLAKVFITGLCVLSSSVVIAQGVDAEANRMNPNEPSRPGMDRENSRILDQDRAKDRMDRMDTQQRVDTQNTKEKVQDHSQAGVKSDNTGTNVQDRSDTASTAGDQSNEKNDLAITQRIRKDLVENDYLSTYAKNVKVITNQGKVILRGPVNSAKEKNDIEVIAKNIAGARNVENRLTVEQ